MVYLHDNLYLYDCIDEDYNIIIILYSSVCVVYRRYYVAPSRII